MRLGANAISFLFAFTISVILSFTVSVLGFISFKEFVFVLLLFLILTFALTRVILHVFFFKDLKKIYRLFKMVRQGKELDTEKQKPGFFFNDTLRKLNNDMLRFSESKKDEINSLKKMEAFRREFMADVSHELKTPIFSAQGFLHTLIDGAIDDKKVRMKFLEKATANLDGLDVLVQDLLSISQMEAGEVIMDFYSFDIVEVVKDIFDQLEDTAEESKVKLGFDKKFIGEPIYVEADSRRIGQVIRNLIVNGIFYSKKSGGKVTVLLEEKSGKVKVSITDQGLGIPKEEVNRIFERFYRVDKSRSKGKGGTGLGLSIVKHIVEAHGSNVSVSSTVGKGSTFSFTLKKGSSI